MPDPFTTSSQEKRNAKPQFAHSLNGAGKLSLPLSRDLESDPVRGTLLALERRLDAIRKEQIAKNRSSLGQFDSQQLQAVEFVTANITQKIFREIADELQHSATEDDGKRLSETVCLMLNLA